MRKQTVTHHVSYPDLTTQTPGSQKQIKLVTDETKLQGRQARCKVNKSYIPQSWQARVF